VSGAAPHRTAPHRTTPHRTAPRQSARYGTGLHHTEGRDGVDAPQPHRPDQNQPA
jgi:hypothetical protein